MLRWLMLRILGWYQLCLRPVFFSACRYSPSCSEYAKQAILKYGALKGSLLAAKRVFSCHPLSHRSNYDPLR
jgi:putative membrane protein insertion efficiency factor